MFRRLICSTLAATLMAMLALQGGLAQEKKEEKKVEKKEEKKAEPKKLPVPAIPPTAANLPYGTLDRQVLDFWQAKSDKPTRASIKVLADGMRVRVATRSGMQLDK